MRTHVAPWDRSPDGGLRIWPRWRVAVYRREEYYSRPHPSRVGTGVLRLLDWGRGMPSDMEDPLPHGAGETSYKRCWNAIAESQANAYCMVDESASEEQLVTRGRFAAEALKLGLALGKHDSVLDIGCGVARVGKELAGIVGRWVGVDVSENMLQIARHRLGGFENVTLLPVSGANLAPVPDQSVDKAYCHAVFIHMDKEDFYSYLLEIRRVLRPEGLFYFDVWNICHDAGWLRWEYERSMYSDRDHRPIHRNQFHSPDEVKMMLRKAGWTALHVAENYQVQVVASYPKDRGGDATWLDRMAQKYNRCFEHLRWRDDNVAEVVRLVQARMPSK